jgi:hypothetical protein
VPPAFQRSRAKSERALFLQIQCKTGANHFCAGKSNCAPSCGDVVILAQAMAIVTASLTA